MTKYTADTHALPYPEGVDKVAVHSDIQALAAKTGIAISQEGARVESSITDRFSTSHVALDTDGTPFYSPGSMSVQILQDADGVPYFRAS